ncbi:unnamed protein product, partial [Staurois parvus]
SVVLCVPGTQRITDQQKEPKSSALLCDQLCPITADRSEGTSTVIISALMISVAPSVPPVSVHQCHLSLPIYAACQCTSMPHISAYQCTSMPHISAHLSCLSVPTVSVSQCHL